MPLFRAKGNMGGQPSRGDRLAFDVNFDCFRPFLLVIGPCSSWAYEDQ